MTIRSPPTSATRLPRPTGRSFTDDGFYCTGDRVVRDDAGYITVVGRDKDQINRAGEKVATDGEVVSGDSAVDNSVITGEALPVEVRAGSAVVGASMNSAGEESMISLSSKKLKKLLMPLSCRAWEVFSLPCS